MQLSRKFTFALIAIGLVALLAATVGHSAGRRAAGGSPLFSPFGPVSSVADAAGRGNKSLCHAGSVCYTPQQLQAAYDWPNGRNAPDGSGQTIAVVVAFGDATLASDLQQFDTLFGLPPANVVTCGTTVGDPAWGPETAADVEYAHAMAPGATILLVVSPSDDDDAMFGAEASCLTGKPNVVVSQSFGDDESSAGLATIQRAHALFQTLTSQGDTLVAGSGDFGATEENDDTPTAEYPSSDPLVTAVGGTEGKPYPGGLLRGRNDYGDEQVWNEGDTFDLATGGAPSSVFAQPAYQQGFSRFDARTTSDVAYNAAIDGGEVVVYGGQVGNFGGTSAGVPHWAAIFALANELRAERGQDAIGQANPELYAIAASRHDYNQDFHDITAGDNQLDSDVGFRAGNGYDLPTGLGTPDVSRLLGDLAGRRSHHRDDSGDDTPGQPSPGGNGHHGRHSMSPS